MIQPYWQSEQTTLYQGDVFDILPWIQSESVHCCVTSPPYWALRDYGVDGQIGLEETIEEYLEKMVLVFREVKRILRDDGTLWLNMGDTYNFGKVRPMEALNAGGYCNSDTLSRQRISSLKPKDLIGIPWRLAFALQADGWYLRSDIIWHKPNAMPESVKDRPTKCHEYLFLLSKNKKYYYDAQAIREPVTGNAHSRGNGVNPKAKVPLNWDTDPGAHKRHNRCGRNSHTRVDRTPNNRHGKVKQNESFSASISGLVQTRNKRSVWSVGTSPCTFAHFATFPAKLIEPCILAGCPIEGIVLDPFAGSGTTLRVAKRLNRQAIGIELNPEYCEIAKKQFEVA